MKAIVAAGITLAKNAVRFNASTDAAGGEQSPRNSYWLEIWLSTSVLRVSLVDQALKRQQAAALEQQQPERANASDE